MIIYTDATLGTLGFCVSYKEHRFYGNALSAVDRTNHHKYIVDPADRDNIQLYETEVVVSIQCYLNDFHETLFPVSILEDDFKNIPKYFFVDNVCSLATLVKGYSRNQLFNTLIRNFWLEAVSSGSMEVWLERVESAHNIADLPSRQMGRIWYLEERGYQYVPNFKSVLFTRRMRDV
ncbi:hypothetical protein DIPPA_29553 [Diplonema papillatum]|nr:hypothetical protein DIPPA_29553 [Diplonema papillatum]